MTGALEILLIAFVAQLAVLPGEKVQFIIAGLATRYHPLLVVAAAGTAFAGWTVLEILFGSAIQGVLPGTTLELITAGMFLLFSILLISSAPADGSVATDGGMLTLGDEPLDVTVLGYEVPEVLGGFLPIFAMMVTGEFGDKTQMVTIALAIQYGAHPAIWLGEMLAIIPVSLANAYFFHRFAGRFDLRRAHFVAAGLFLFFGLDTLLKVATGFSLWETVIGTVSEVPFSSMPSTPL
jgi:putative Ca2+/H+ antiporter (TMEM165/GDT1 family)